MDNDKFQGLGNSGFHANSPQSWGSFGMNPDPSPLSSSASQLPPMPPQLGGGSVSGSDAGHFSHDLNMMTDNLPRTLAHRRAHSEILLPVPDDLSFESDLGVGGGRPSLSGEAEDDLLSMYLDMDQFDSSAMSSFQVREDSTSASAAAAGTVFSSDFAARNGSFEPFAASGLNRAIGHQHSMSMDGSTSMLNEMLMSGSTSASAAAPGTVFSSDFSARNGSFEPFAASCLSRAIGHQHSMSMDGSTSILNEMLLSGSDQGPSPSPKDLKKAMSTAKLAELAIIDPKRAKRILANRQSAARSKERKMQYINELERKVQSLKMETASLSAQVVLLKRDTNGLTAENNELKQRLQTMEQQVHFKDALNDALNEEIVQLKVQTGQTMPSSGCLMNFSACESAQQCYPDNQAIHTLPTAQFQQLQIHPQMQPQQQQQQQHHQQFEQQHLHLHHLQQQRHHQQEYLQQLGSSMPSARQNDGNATEFPSFMKD